MTQDQTISVDTKSSKKAFKPIAIFLAILAISSGSYWVYWDQYASKIETTENAYVAANQVSVTAPVSGTIVGVYIQDTQPIEVNKIALKIDNTDFKLALDKAASDLAKAVRGLKTQQIQVLSAEKAIRLRQLELAKMNEDLEREKKAFEAGLVTQEDFLAHKFKVDQAKLTLDTADISKDIAKSQSFSKTLEDYPEVAKAISAYKQAFIDLSKSTIKTPVDGLVAKKAVNLGQKVSAGQVLFSIVDVAHEWVDANLKESQLKNIKPGQAVSLVSDVNGKTYAGVVQSIGAGSGSSLSLLPAQNATGNWIKVVQRVPVRIELDPVSVKQNGVLPAGTSMRITIDTRTMSALPPARVQELQIDLDEALMQKNIADIIAANLMK